MIRRRRMPRNRNYAEKEEKNKKEENVNKNYDEKEENDKNTENAEKQGLC